MKSWKILPQCIFLVLFVYCSSCEITNETPLGNSGFILNLFVWYLLLLTWRLAGKVSVWSNYNNNITKLFVLSFWGVSEFPSQWKEQKRSTVELFCFVAELWQPAGCLHSSVISPLSTAALQVSARSLPGLCDPWGPAGRPVTSSWSPRIQREGLLTTVHPKKQSGSVRCEGLITTLSGAWSLEVTDSTMELKENLWEGEINATRISKDLRLTCFWSNVVLRNTEMAHLDIFF